MSVSHAEFYSPQVELVKIFFTIRCMLTRYLDGNWKRLTADYNKTDDITKLKEIRNCYSDN